MIQLFVPYTAFHIASYLRSFRMNGFSPSVVYVLIGFGTTRTKSGVRYTAALISELESSVACKVLDVRRVKDLFLLMLILGSKFYLVTGNPRRTPSLFFARFSDSVQIVDEGSGTTKCGEYFDPRIEERSRAKIFAQRLRLLPSYRDVFDKITGHCTVYNWSIFNNFKKIPFEPGISSCFIKRPREKRIQIFLSSSARICSRFDYAEWAKSLLVGRVEDDFVITYFSPHPADSLELTSFLLKELGLKLLPSDGVLFEDYVIHLCRSGVDVFVVGEPNSSTLLLETLHVSNLFLNLSPFKKG